MKQERFLVALIGLPCVGKSRVAEFLQDAGASCYSWGDAAQKLIANLFGDCSWNSVTRFTWEVEANDRTIVAREFLRCSNIAHDQTKVIVIDGVKNREQLNLLVTNTGRTPIVIGVIRDEAERKEAVKARGEFDDFFDHERLVMLMRVGLHMILSESDIFVDLTGIRLRKVDGHKFWIRLPKCFVRSMAKVLLDLGLPSGQKEAIYPWLVSCAERRAAKAGYEPLVDHSLIKREVSP